MISRRTFEQVHLILQLFNNPMQNFRALAAAVLNQAIEDQTKNCCLLETQKERATQSHRLEVARRELDRTKVFIDRANSRWQSQSARLSCQLQTRLKSLEDNHARFAEKQRASSAARIANRIAIIQSRPKWSAKRRQREIDKITAERQAQRDARIQSHAEMTERCVLRAQSSVERQIEQFRQYYEKRLEILNARQSAQQHKLNLLKKIQEIMRPWLDAKAWLSDPQYQDTLQFWCDLAGVKAEIYRKQASRAVRAIQRGMPVSAIYV